MGHFSCRLSRQPPQPEQSGPHLERIRPAAASLGRGPASCAEARDHGVHQGQDRDRDIRFRRICAHSSPVASVVTRPRVGVDAKTPERPGIRDATTPYQRNRYAPWAPSRETAAWSAVRAVTEPVVREGRTSRPGGRCVPPRSPCRLLRPPLLLGTWRSACGSRSNSSLVCRSWWGQPDEGGGQWPSATSSGYLKPTRRGPRRSDGTCGGLATHLRSSGSGAPVRAPQVHLRINESAWSRRGNTVRGAVGASGLPGGSGPRCV